MARLAWWGSGALVAAVLLGILLTSGGADAPSSLDVWWHDAMVQARPDALVAFSHVMNRIGGGWIAVFVVPLGIAAALLIARRRRAAVFAVAAFAVSAVLVQLLKQLFGRARPEDMLVVSDFGSFPSGHTANAATIAVVVCVLFPRVWTVLLGVAWIVAMAGSRTVLAVHWVTDTVGGALVGAAAGLLVAAVLLPWVRRGSAAKVVSTAPSAEEKPMVRIRPYRPADRAALFEVCVKTADAGSDATGIFSDDELWGLLFAVPYAERRPDLCWVVEAEDGAVVGYLVATEDTDAFEQWFRDEWWPQFAERFPAPADPVSREEKMLAYAYGRGPGKEPNAADYPAHLHIDLLPAAQGQGLGRRLLETLFDELRRRGVAGLHLGMDPANTGAGAFYDRIGMQRLDAPEGTVVYGIRFDG
ncbi:GNAT family N-acetyltransferase [Microbacterium sp. NPDC055903]